LPTRSARRSVKRAPSATHAGRGGPQIATLSQLQRDRRCRLNTLAQGKSKNPRRIVPARYLSRQIPVSPLARVLQVYRPTGYLRQNLEVCCSFIPGIYFSLLYFFMVALCNRADHIYFHPVVSFHLLSSSFFSSPNLSGRRLDVYHTSTHGVALVRI